MKILYLSPTGALGGAEKVLLSVMQAVRQTRPDVQIRLLCLSPGPLVDRAAALGAEVAVLPLPGGVESLGDSQLSGGGNRARTLVRVLGQALRSGPAGWVYVRRLRQTMAQIGPDLIHSNGIKTHCLAWLANPAKIPVVWHVHDFLSTRSLARPLLRLAARRIAGAIAISQAVATDFKIAGMEAPIRVISNAVDVNKYSPMQADPTLLDRLAGMDPGPASCLRVGLIGSYARWKGQGVFLAAAARLVQNLPAQPVRFYIIGGPIYQTRGSQFEVAELREMALRLGVDRQTGFIGFQEDVVPIYRALDVVVHASTAPEPFGLTIIEAMACGRPVIAAMAGGVAEIIHPGYDALGTPPGDVQALALAMQSLLEDSALRATLATRGRATVCGNFDQKRLGVQIFDTYDELGNSGKLAERT